MKNTTASWTTGRKPIRYFSFATLLILLTVTPCLAATGLAPTPPMGWNSWDSYGLTVTEAEFKANVSWLHQHLQPLGWQYVVVDEGRTCGNRVKRAPRRDLSWIPTAVTWWRQALFVLRIKPLADWVHAQGLKFGLHIIRGIPRPTTTSEQV